MYVFDSNINRYRAANGRIVSWARVRGARQSAIEMARREMRDLGQSFREGGISLIAWQESMAERVKAIHLASGALPMGGVNALDDDDTATIEREIARELTALRRFAREIASGEQLADGTMLRRGDHYARAGRKTFHIMLRRQMLRLGFIRERSARTAEERSCNGCRIEEVRGFVPIGSLIPIGDRTCVRNCQCLLFFEAADGKVSGPF